MNPHRVLIIAHDFPPRGGVAAQRIAKLVKYLPAAGWDPIVVAARFNYRRPLDHSLEKDVEGVEVFRAVNFEPTSSVPGVPYRVKRAIDSYVFVPDSARPWLRPAIKTARRLIETRGISAVFATGSPWTALLVGHHVKASTGIPLVIEFRDPWIAHDDSSHSARRDQGERAKALEVAVVRSADAVVAATEPITRMLAERYPYARDHLGVVTNGFDPDDFSPDPILRGTDNFLLTNHGSMYADKEIAWFFRGLSLAARNDPQFAQDVRVEIVGGLNRGSVRFFTRGLTPTPKVVSVPRVDHADSVRIMLQSAALLLLRSQDWAYSAKIFEYLASRRPILALVPPKSPAAEVVREANAGIVVPPNDDRALAAALRDMHRDWKRGVKPASTNWNELQRFAWPNVAADLARVLSAVT